MPRGLSRGQDDRGLPAELSKLSERGYEDSSFCKPEFITAFDALNGEARREIAEVLEELIFEYWDAPPSHPNMKYIESDDVWQLTVKEDHTDHRIYIDWSREEPIPVILSLLHADQTH